MDMYLIQRNRDPQFIAPSRETADKVVSYNNSVDTTGTWEAIAITYLPHNPVTTAKPWMIDLKNGEAYETTINPQTFGVSDKELPGSYFLTYRASERGARLALNNWKKK